MTHPAPAFSDLPRPLTAAEQARVAHFLHRDTGALYFAVPMLGGVGVCAWMTCDSARRGDWMTVAMMAVATGACAVFAWMAMGMALRPHPLGRPTEFWRAQRLHGRLAFPGVPPRPTIGGVRVVSPSLDDLPAGAMVEVDVSPAFTDDPRPERARIVVQGPRVMTWPGARTNEDLATSA